MLSVFAGLMILSCLSVTVNPAKVWLMNVLGMMYMPLLLLNIFLMAWAMKRKSLSFLIPLVAIVPACFFFRFFVQTAKPEQTRSAELSSGVRIMSYNIGRFAISDIKGDRLQRTDSLFNYLAQTNSDIICLQEYFGRDAAELSAFAEKYLPGYNVDYYFFTGKYGRFGNVTLSRIPVLGKGKLLFPESRNLAIYTEYALGGGKFRVYNCHLESYAISLSNVWKAVKGDRKMFQETGRKMRRSIIKRPMQVDNVLSSIENSNTRSFVCGDFNDNPISNTYYRLAKGRSDSFTVAGHGFGASYRAFWPLIRIDYIFCPEGTSPVSHYTPKVDYSDHYPIISDIRVGKD